MSDNHCGTCAYNGLMSGDCYFPKPQDGTDGPFMAPAAMPDVDNDGENCVHWKQHSKRMSATNGKEE